MIDTAQVTGARAVQDDARNGKYLASKPEYPRTWLAEQMGQMSDSEWRALLTQMDHSAALEQSSQAMLELTDLFCLLRDSRYAGRSRRWLYTRAAQTRGLRNYEAWRAFVQENPTADLQGKFLNVDPKTLASQPYQLLLDLNPAQTKRQQALVTLKSKNT